MTAEMTFHTGRAVASVLQSKRFDCRLVVLVMVARISGYTLGWVLKSGLVSIKMGQMLSKVNGKRDLLICLIHPRLAIL